MRAIAFGAGGAVVGFLAALTIALIRGVVLGGGTISIGIPGPVWLLFLGPAVGLVLGVAASRSISR